MSRQRLLLLHLLTAGLSRDIVLALLLWRLALAWVRWREEAQVP